MCPGSYVVDANSNRLQPNPDKTEVLWCTIIRRQHCLPTSSLMINGCSVTLVSTIRDFGIYIDSDLSMQVRVKYTVSRCFTSLRRLCQIRRCVPQATLQMMMPWCRLQTGLREWCIGRPSGLPDAPTPVSPQCSCVTDLLSQD